MSEVFNRGRDWERKVFKTMSQILRIPMKRDSKSGSGLYKADGRDQFNVVPLFIECKDQEKLNVKTDWRIASAKASIGYAPVVVFPDQEKKLCVMRFEDLLQILRESMDWRETADQLRIVQRPVAAPAAQLVNNVLPASAQGVQTCREGHIADTYGYCMDKKCRFTRGYKAPKKKG